MCTYSGDKELAIARVNGEIEFFELDYTEFSKNLEIYSEKKKLKAFDFSPAQFEISSLNDQEVPYLAAVAHDFSRIYLKIFHQKNHEILLRINNDFTNISGGSSLLNCTLGIIYLKEAKRMKKYDPDAFIDSLRVIFEDFTKTSINIFQEEKNDLKLTHTLGLTSGISGCMLLKN